MPLFSDELYGPLITHNIENWLDCHFYFLYFLRKNKYLKDVVIASSRSRINLNFHKICAEFCQKKKWRRMMGGGWMSKEMSCNNTLQSPGPKSELDYDVFHQSSCWYRRLHVIILKLCNSMARWTFGSLCLFFCFCFVFIWVFAFVFTLCTVFRISFSNICSLCLWHERRNFFHELKSFRPTFQKHIKLNSDLHKILLLYFESGPGCICKNIPQNCCSE